MDALEVLKQPSWTGLDTHMLKQEQTVARLPSICTSTLKTTLSINKDAPAVFRHALGSSTELSFTHLLLLEQEVDLLN